MTQALTFPSVYAVGSIDAYIQAVRQIPRLTEKQEFDLATRLRNENDLDAARQLVLSHLRLVISVSRGYLGYGIPHADLIQEGSIGLMKAVKRFEPARGVRLVSFAVHWIKAEIHEYILKNWRMVKLATTKAQRKLFFNLRSMKVNRSGVGAQEAASIAQRLNVKPAEVAEMDTRLSGHDTAFDAQADDDEAFVPAAYLADHSREPVHVLEGRDRERLYTEDLQRALGSLDPRSGRIVESRWLREEDPATLHELAGEFHVSAERIRQIEIQAMRKLRANLAPLVASA